MRAVRRAMDALERAEILDAPAAAIAGTFRSRLGPGALKDAISGTWLGHALHPMLTDVVIGAFVSASLLDLLGTDRDGKSTERLIAIGVLAYPATAVTGTSDWADSELGDARVRRVGLAHAAVNAVSLTLYTFSLIARRRGARGRGKLLGLAGATALGAAGYLGAHMSFVQGVGVDQTAFDPGPDDWTHAAESGSVPAGQLCRVVVDETPVLVLRHHDGLHAIHDRCSHRGCALSDGEVDGEAVVCPCHGSRFRLEDGAIERGPATVPQPAYETRESGGRIEIRRRSFALR
jgi:nitrite reductase/ring-hydroxylating ferredoxin subunit/uncharacterized membrane protein